MPNRKNKTVKNRTGKNGTEKNGHEKIKTGKNEQEHRT